MTAAAAELGVTHGAVSRQIKVLETHVGVRLLQRLPRRLKPTVEGAALASELSEAFDRVRSALSRVQRRQVTLSCSATIMMFWLLPRLADFKRLYPEIDLRLDVNYGEVDFIRDEISLAIRNSMYQPPTGTKAERLMIEEVGPVCHPLYAERLGIAEVSDLARVRLLVTATRPKAWREWADAMDAAGLPAPEHETFEHFYLTVQAALYGLGLAIVPRLLVAGEIEAGHLIAPLGFVAGPHALQLWVAEHLCAQEDVSLVAAWIRGEMTTS